MFRFKRNSQHATTADAAVNTALPEPTERQEKIIGKVFRRTPYIVGSQGAASRLELVLDTESGRQIMRDISDFSVRKGDKVEIITTYMKREAHRWSYEGRQLKIIEWADDPAPGPTDEELRD